MPSNGNINTSGLPIGSSTLKSTVDGIFGQSNKLKNQFIYRVTALGENGIVYYEIVKKQYGQSNIGTPNLNNIAYPSSQGLIKMPKVGEYVDIFMGPAPFAAGENKSTPVNIAYWNSSHGPLNIWNQGLARSGSGPIDNISLDPSVQGQVNNDKMTNINLSNFNNSLIGF